jgi:hypothetical protein
MLCERPRNKLLYHAYSPTGTSDMIHLNVTALRTDKGEALVQLLLIFLLTASFETLIVVTVIKGRECI